MRLRLNLGPAIAARARNATRALQSVVSSLAETDPQAALNMLQTLPNAAGESAKLLLADLFPLGQQRPGHGRDPAAALPPGSGHDNALQVVASTWANQDPQAAFNWSEYLARRARVATMRCKASCPPGPKKIHRSRHDHCRPSRSGPLRDQATGQYCAAMGAERSQRRARLDPGRCRLAKDNAARCKAFSPVGRKTIRPPPPIMSRPCPPAKCRRTQ